jgi:uncharacterized protein YfcZ (UPF0381/DUF406 family)
MTDSNSVYTMREINLEQCSFTKPEIFKDYHESFVSINGSRGFMLQSPKLILRNSTPTYFEFLISRNKDRHREFYNIVSHLEDSAIIKITENSKEWFNRDIRRDQVETMFRSCIHRPLEINDPYILRINKIPGLDMEINYPVVCLIKIDGILFGKNSSTIDMKIIRIKVIKTDKIASDEDYVDHQSSMPLEKPFYNDNASIVPHDFSDTKKPAIVTNLEAINEETSVSKMIEKVDEFYENKQQLADIEKTEKFMEKMIEKVPEIESEPIPVVSEFLNVRSELPLEPGFRNETESIQIESQSVFENSIEKLIEPQSPVKTVQIQPLVSTDSIKCEIMKAIVENDFQRVKKLTEMLNTL